MPVMFKCPVCKKDLTEAEYDKALGLWKDKQEHIKHLEEEQKKLKEREKNIKKTLDVEKRKLKQKETQFRTQIQIQVKKFKQEQAKLKVETKQALAEQKRKADRQIKDQRAQLQKTFQERMKVEVKKGVEQGIDEQKRQFKKQEADLKKTKNKMGQLEKSLKLSAQKYEVANNEIKKLKEQIERGITPQIEGLLEEGKLLAKLREMFPQDKYEHPGKGGDIIQYVIEQGRTIGKIVYECKKVKSYSPKFVEQAKEARCLREADFAVLVTNAFPSKKQYYFVDKAVFVISPVSLEPIVYTLRESLVKIAVLKLSNEAKQKAVQQVYDYLSSPGYNNKINDVANQLVDLAKDLKIEIKSHRDRWEKRYTVYHALFSDVNTIDFTLRGLLHGKNGDNLKLLGSPQRCFVEIEEFN
jgi:hypothetical protein